MDEPTMRIGEAARRAGVAPATIRAWQRRYGLLAPARSDGGQRLFSEGDVLALIAVRHHVESGWALSAAAAHVARAQRERLAGEPVLAGDSGASPGLLTSARGPASVSNPPARTKAARTGPTTAVADRQEAGETSDDQEMLAATHVAVRSLLRAASPSAVTATLADLVETLGGTVGPAALQRDDVIPIDLSLGEGEPLLPRAPQLSVARLRLEAVLPGLVEDARHVVALLRAADG